MAPGYASTAIQSDTTNSNTPNSRNPLLSQRMGAKARSVLNAAAESRAEGDGIMPPTSSRTQDKIVKERVLVGFISVDSPQVPEHTEQGQQHR